jgi:YidC/Oxa1 family membrane protein insertase
MDSKRLIYAMLAGLVLMLGWLWLVQYLDKANPHWGLLRQNPTTQPVAPAPVAPPGLMPPAVAPPVAATMPGVATGMTTGAATTRSVAPESAVTPGVMSARGASTPSREILLGSQTANDPTYSLGLRLSGRGGGIEGVTLTRYRKLVDQPLPYVFQQPSSVEGMADLTRVLATQTVTFNNVPVSLGGLVWKLDKYDAESASFSAEVERDGRPALRLGVTYRIEPMSAAGGGYEVRAEYSITNTSEVTALTQALLTGPAAPPWEIERGPERQIIRAYLAQDRPEVVIRHTMAEEFSATKATIDVTAKDAGSTDPMSWYGGSGAYFNAILRFDPFPGATGQAANYIARVQATMVNPGHPDPHIRDITTTVQTHPMQLAPGQTVTMPLRLYFGPKKRDLLEQPHYANLPLAYNLSLVMTSWICSFCTFPWLIGLLVWMLNGFHFLVRDWGLAIILLVVVVRALLHPITRKQQENMHKMSKMAPELERLKKKYGDDKDGMNRELMAYYKEHGFTPIWGCLPVFLQMPIWLALYAALQSTFELRHQPFMYGVTWISDLAKPDHLMYFPSFMLCGMLPISGLNLIPFLLAVVFYLQFKFTPKPAVQTPEQIQQQKIMQWMTLIFPVFLYSMPAGLNIYILTSTTFGIIENKLIRDRIKRREALEGEGRVVVDAGPTRGSKQAALERKQPKGKKGLLAFLENMQEKAEEIRRQQEKNKKKNP